MNRDPLAYYNQLRYAGNGRHTQENPGNARENGPKYNGIFAGKLRPRVCAPMHTQAHALLRAHTAPQGHTPPGSKKFPSGPLSDLDWARLREKFPYQRTPEHPRPEAAGNGFPLGFFVLPKTGKNPDFQSNKDPSGLLGVLFYALAMAWAFILLFGGCAQVGHISIFTRSGSRIYPVNQDPAGSQQLPGPTVSPLVLPDRPGCPGSRRRAAAARAYRVPAGAAGSPRMPRILPEGSSCQGLPCPCWCCRIAQDAPDPAGS